MLYYVLANGTHPRVESTEEKPPSTIRKTVSALTAELNQSSMDLQSICSPLPLTAPTEPKAHRDRAAAKFKAKGTGPNPNAIPLGRPRPQRSDQKAPAGPSGQQLGGSEGGSRAPVAPAPTVQGATKPKKFDPRRRSDQPGAHKGFRTSLVDRK